jgi:hypothetical protein
VESVGLALRQGDRLQASSYVGVGISPDFDGASGDGDGFSLEDGVVFVALEGGDHGAGL